MASVARGCPFMIIFHSVSALFSALHLALPPSRVAKRTRFLLLVFSSLFFYSSFLFLYLLLPASHLLLLNSPLAEGKSFGVLGHMSNLAYVV